MVKRRAPVNPPRDTMRRSAKLLTPALVVLAALGPTLVQAATSSAIAGASTSTWELSTTVPFAAGLYAADCPSKSVCYVTGEDTSGAAVIEATKNAGTTWQAQTPAASTRAALGISCHTGTACVGGGTNMTAGVTVFFTRNAGTTWTRGTTTAPITPFSYFDSFSCPSTTECVGVGSSSQPDAIAVSTDGGTTWTVPLAFTSALTGVSCPTTTKCVTVGNTSLTTRPDTYYSATPHGVWTESAPPATVKSLQSVSCSSASDCVAVGQTTTGGAAIIETTDGGVSWSSVSPPSTLASPAILNGVSCVSPTQCEAVGTSAGHGVATATTTGTAWTRQTVASTPSPYRLSAVSCAATTCVAAGMSPTTIGVVLKLGAVATTATTVSGRRISGPTAPGSSVAGFEHQFPIADGGCPGTAGDRPVILATDAGFPDALVSSYLAGHLDTATLVTPPRSLAPVVRTALVDEGVTHVYVVGGPLAVSTAVVRAIRALPVHTCGGAGAPGTSHVTVSRIYGRTALATAAAVAEYLPAADVGTASLSASYAGTNAMGGRGRYNTTEGNGSASPRSPGHLRTALLSTLSTFMDTESASSVSYAAHFPMLLTKAAALSGQARSAIEALHVAQVVVIGGQLAVSNPAVRSLEAMGVSVVRVAGIDYEGTAAEVADFELGSTSTGLGLGWRPTGGVVVASGADFGASVTGAVVAADGGPGRRWPEPLLLTQDATVLGTSLTSFLRSAGRTGVDHDHVQLASVVLLGDPGVISDHALERMESYLSA